ncbi:MAG: hypothetical protein ACR2JB_15120, partial [Bryobacteraceae bacterium]
ERREKGKKPLFFVSEDPENCFWGKTGDEFGCQLSPPPPPVHNFRIRNATTFSRKFPQVPHPHLSH